MSAAAPGKDLLELGQRRLCHVVAHTAAGDAPAGTIASESRCTVAYGLLADSTDDEGVLNMAMDESHFSIMKLAKANVASLDDVAAKLAVAVKHVVSLDITLDGPQTELLCLTAGALADLVLLRGGAIELPPGATAPIANAGDAARWAERAAELGP